MLLRLAAKTAESHLSYAEQLKMMRANAPKVEEIGKYWVVKVYSPFVKKYIAQGEWLDEKAANDDLVVWTKAHKETLSKLKQRVSKEASDKTSSTHGVANPVSAYLELVDDRDDEGNYGLEVGPRKDFLWGTLDDLIRYCEAMKKSVDVSLRSLLRLSRATRR